MSPNLLRNAKLMLNETQDKNCRTLRRGSGSSRILDVVSLDIVGPLPVTERGKKYLFIFIEYFTRFCEAIPISRQDIGTIAREFVTKIITQFGVPKKLLTDRGKSSLLL